jgi:23S rRNA (cytosine1962-C5)-methyltransferase
MINEKMPKIILKKNRDSAFFEKHPWLFSGAIDRIEGEVADGGEVVVLTNAKQFIAYGLYNSKSQIRVRLYSWNEKQNITDDFIFLKIENAISLRKNILNLYKNDNACRLIFSEGDGISGLTVDKYAEFLVIQITSFALYQKIEVIKNILIAQCKPKGIYIRTEKGIGESEGLELKDGHLWGVEPEKPITIIENDIIFEVDLRTGQKTGFYVDQRDNRKAIRDYVSGKNVLDVCCYTGGFSLNAAKYGAKEVTAVDVSESALKIAEQNMKLNKLTNISFEKSDAFKFLESQIINNKKYDLIILDPPKFSHSKSTSQSAIKGYVDLNSLALNCLSGNGILVTCSCSGRVSKEDFLHAIHKASIKSKRDLQVLEFRGQSKDHPVSITCPESLYLKCFICKTD